MNPLNYQNVDSDYQWNPNPDNSAQDNPFVDTSSREGNPFIFDQPGGKPKKYNEVLDNAAQRFTRQMASSGPIGAILQNAAPFSDRLRALAKLENAAYGFAPQNIIENPLKAAIGGLPGVQAWSGSKTVQDIYNLGAGPGVAPMDKYKTENTIFSDLVKPQTEEGAVLGTLGDVAGFAESALSPTGMPKVAGGAFVAGKSIGSKLGRFIGDITVPGTRRAKLTKEIQRSFGPWARNQSKTFERLKNQNINSAVSEGRDLSVSLNDLNSIFGKALDATSDVGANLSPKAKKYIYLTLDKLTNPNINNTKINGIKTLDKLESVLSKGLPRAQRTGFVSTPESEAIRSVSGNIRNFINSKVPDVSGANPYWTDVVAKREFLNKFQPWRARAKGGTAAGAKELRKVNEWELDETNALKELNDYSSLPKAGKDPSELLFMHKFGKDYVKQAKGIEAGRQIRHAVGTVLPYVTALGAAGYLGRNAITRLFSGGQSH